MQLRSPKRKNNALFFCIMYDTESEERLVRPDGPLESSEPEGIPGCNEESASPWGPHILGRALPLDLRVSETGRVSPGAEGPSLPLILGATFNQTK